MSSSCEIGSQAGASTSSKLRRRNGGWTPASVVKSNELDFTVDECLLVSIHEWAPSP